GGRRFLLRRRLLRRRVLGGPERLGVDVVDVGYVGERDVLAVLLEFLGLAEPLCVLVDELLVLEVFLDLAHPAPPGGAAETARRPGGVLTAAAPIELVVREAREDDRHVARTLPDAGAAAPGPRAPPLHRRSFICVRADDEQLVL